MIRFFDIIFSVIIVLFLLPLLIIVVFFQIIIDGKPIFFKHKRVGIKENEFYLYKFRSMKINQNLSNNNFRTEFNDPRITSFGKIIRKYSIDELPQLFNVIIGEMSLVGPRPDTIMQKNEYPIEVWNRRVSVKPGLTGLAQVNGRSELNFKERYNYDIEWVNRKSNILYIIILIKTFFVFFKNSN